MATRIPSRIRALITLAVVGVFAMAFPVTASAACPAAERDRLSAAERLSHDITARGAAGAAEAQAVVSRAVAGCRGALHALAVAHLTRQHGVPVDGSRYTYRGLVYAGQAGSFSFRPAASLRPLARTRSNSAATAQAATLTRLAHVTRTGVLWSSDPTRPSFDPALQSQAARVLSKSRTGTGLRLAERSLGAFAGRRAMAQFRATHVLATAQVAVDAVLAANRLSARSGRLIAARLARLAAYRVRSTDTGSWTRIDGRDATLAEHRSMTAAMSTLARLQSTELLRRTHASLRRALRTSPRVRYRSVPHGSFYPWPRDGVLDTQSLSAGVDKPLVMKLRIFTLTGQLVAVREQSLASGDWTGVWDGAGEGGRQLGAGMYRYSLEATDLAGNSRVVPGLGSFRIARDTNPPRIGEAAAQYRGGKRKRYLRVNWTVQEQLSPLVDVALALRGTGGRDYVPVARHQLSGSRTVVTVLPKGTYRVYLVVRDGSANRSIKRLADASF